MEIKPNALEYQNGHKIYTNFSFKVFKNNPEFGFLV
jgi:hypothetical protein